MNTGVRKLDLAADCRETIREAADCLAAGGLVVFPTETVYGVGASAADTRAVARLREVKQRHEGKPFTVHIGSRSAVNRFVPGLEGVGRRLAEKAWPGPLTLIFHVEEVAAAPVIQEVSMDHAAAMYHEGTIGIRCPDHRMAADLLAGARVPVVAASANAAGAPAPVDADEALTALEGQVDLLLDAGRTRYAKPSTIIRVNRDGYDLVREGVLDERTIRRLTGVRFLLICSGNTCRSPMAEGLLRRMLAERLGCPQSELEDRGYHIESAGAFATAGIPPSPPAVEAMNTRSIDIASHRSQRLTLDQINRADYVFVMTAAHIEAAAALTTSARDRTRRLDDEDIEDPIGGSDAVYARCAQRIEQALRRRLEEIPL